MKKLIVMFSALVLATVGLTAAAQTGDGATPAEETFCDDNFDGRLRGLCNAFCEAIDCDSDEPNGSARACLKLENKIQPLLAAHNTENNTDFVIEMSDVLGGVDGRCGERVVVETCPTEDLCPQDFIDFCANLNLDCCNFGCIPN